MWQRRLAPQFYQAATRIHCTRLACVGTSAIRGWCQQENAACAQKAPRANNSRWTTFCSAWNEALTQYPVPMIIFYRGVGTITWAVIFGTLSNCTVASSVLAAPEYAVGWLVMLATVKARQPLNAVIAATLSRSFPALTKLKVSPLLKIFAADKKTWKSMTSARESMENSPKLSEKSQQMVRSGFSNLSRFTRFIEGPIDKYGFSFFIASKSTGLVTLTGGTLAAMYGMDVSTTLSSWGFSTELQSDAGLLACSAAANTFLCPIHFRGAVSAVHHFEGRASEIWHEQLRLKEFDLKLNDSIPSLHVREADTGSAPEGDRSEDDEEMTEADFRQTLLTNIACICVLFDLAFAVYLMRRMAKSASAPVVDNKEVGETIEVIGEAST